MAPSPENDNAPKAPDKSDTNKCEKQGTSDTVKEKDKDEKTLSNLNDGELKALLDEAMNYKNPKDREGKSKLFKDLLIQAEESERIARATSAGGSESARHYNAAARHQRRPAGGDRRRHRRHREPASISENVVQGGSLDNLAKEEMFGESARALDERKSVSARQKEGGSLPCDVNSSANVVPTRDYQFLEEARRRKVIKDKEYTAIDIESTMETERLLDHDSLDKNYPEHQEITILPRYTTNATLQIAATPVDDPIALELDNIVEKKHYDLDGLQSRVLHSKYNVYIPTYRSAEERKIDENGNALHQNQGGKAKKKKTQTDKNVVVLTAESVEGHRSDIIDDVEKLIQYIRGDKGESTSGGKGGRSNMHKSKQLHKQHASEDGGPSGRKKQRANSSKGKESRPELKKSNSLGEIPTATMEEFAFVGSSKDDKDGDSKVVLRQKTQADRPKERRSWGNVEPPPFEVPSSNASTEHLEPADSSTWMVTKAKKKSKRRRNSLGRPAGAPGARGRADRAPAPSAQAARSAPHSEKSNDSSDADSVRSLPVDGPVSYADIAKNGEKVKDKKVSPEKPVPNKEKPPHSEAEAKKPVLEAADGVKNPPPDFNDARSFPAIPVDTSPSKPEVGGSRALPSTNKCAAEKTNVKSAGGGKGVSRSGGATNDAAVVISTIQNDLTMLPPNIPDVQTIEKMHFLNCPPPTAPQQPPLPPTQSPPRPPSDAGAGDDCDAGLPRWQACHSPPAVVILSGAGHKEAADLEFGFDVNEQLLNEDICEDFVARYVPPDQLDAAASAGHDKIVNFIGSSWDAIVNESDGKVEYYKEES